MGPQRVLALQALPKDKRGPDQLPARFIALIGELYRVEALAKEGGVDAGERLWRRQQDGTVVLAKIEALLLEHLHTVLPSSVLGKALHYLASHWPKLRRYVDDGRYAIDNNVCENAIRPFVIGRRNWLFADTVAGANASANRYSLFQTCQVNGIDSYRYLAALFKALPTARTIDDYAEFLPWRIVSAKPAAFLPMDRICEGRSAAACRRIDGVVEPVCGRFAGNLTPAPARGHPRSTS